MPDPRAPSFVDLQWLLEITQDEYVERFRGSAVRRAKRWMLQRNAAVALGNTGGPEALPALVRVLEQSEYPIVRGHAAWAIGQLGRRLGLEGAKAELLTALEREADDYVREEIRLALQDIASDP